MNPTTRLTDSPYVFPELSATRRGIPDPLVEVDAWLGGLRDVLDTALEAPDDALDLVALEARLRRVRPALIEELNGRATRARAAAVLAERGADLVARALAIADPQRWLEQTAALVEAFEEVGSAEQRSDLAERLLTDLDDAELVLYAARRRGFPDADLESRWEPCRQWLAEHAELFLPAAVHVQAVGMSLRPELAEFDYGLAVTALKYLDVLRATKAAEEELALAQVQQLDASVAKHLAARSRDEGQRTAAARAAFLSAVAVALRDRLRQAPLARAGEAVPPEPLYWWLWSSPAGEFTARLTVPPRPAADQRVMLEFLDAAQQRATGLAGQTVTLHGVEAAIDSTGKATFSLVPLLETDQPLVLRVGAQQIEWPLIETHTEP